MIPQQTEHNCKKGLGHDLKLPSPAFNILFLRRAAPWKV